MSHPPRSNRPATVGGVPLFREGTPLLPLAGRSLWRPPDALRSTVMLLFALAAASPAAAQDATIHGQLRPRMEGWTPAGADGGADAFTSMRTRIGIRGRLDRGVSVHFQLQDARVFGEEQGTLTDFHADGLDLHQGWVQLGAFDDAARGPALRVGRQEIALGGQRLVGNVDWTQQARSLDGARVRLRTAPGPIDVFGFTLADASAAGIDRDAVFAGFHAPLRIGSVERFELYGLFNGNGGEPGDDGEAATRQATAGARVVGTARGLRYRGEGYWQFGRRGGREVGAFLAAARVGVPFADGRARVTLWYDHLSGDDRPGAGRVRAFETLLATNHKFYGHADLFLDIPAHTAGRGLRDLALKTSWRARPDLTLAMQLHEFRLADGGGLSTTRLGEEIDLTATRRYGGALRVEAGFSYVVRGDGFAEIGRPTGHVAGGYLMLDATF